jgi:hypothetical protein
VVHASSLPVSGSLASLEASHNSHYEEFKIKHTFRLIFLSMQLDVVILKAMRGYKRLPLLALCFLLACQQKPVSLEDPIQEIPKSRHLGIYDTKAGAQKPLYEVVGKNMPDFYYFDLEGKARSFHDELKKGKPFLLCAGSYSCPVFRRRIPYLNQVHELYGDQIRVLIVYTVEAHPDDVPSPYRDSIWVHQDNWKESVFIHESRTLPERITTARKLQEDFGIQVELGIDVASNTFWYEHGQMPAFAYLIDVNREIMAFHEWLDPATMDKSMYYLRKRIHDRQH